MFEERRQRFILLHRAHKLLEVVETARRFRRFVRLQRIGVAGFVQHHFGQFGVRDVFRQRIPAREIGREFGQRLARLRRQLIGFRNVARGGEQRQVTRPRKCMQRLHGCIADAALGPVDDALEGEIVVALGDQAQIRHGVTDFGALVEARAADHLVRQPERQKAVFEFAHLEGRAHQHRHLREFLVLGVQVLGFAGRRAGFFLRVPHALHLDLLAGVAFGPQGLAEAALVGGDEAGRRAQDGGRGAVVALQADDFRAGKVVLEAQDVVHLRAAPAVDGLVVIAHHAHIAAAPRQQLQPEILHRVGVLIFVHQHVFEALAILGEDLRLCAQDGEHLQQQIAEIRRVQRAQPLLILAIERTPLAVGVGMRFAIGHLFGAKAAVLPVVDKAGERARRPALLVDVLRFDQLLHQAQLVVSIQDGEVGFEAGQLRMAPQHARADGMEGAQPLHPLHHAADEGADALLHLARRLVGEGDGEDLPGPGSAGGEDVGQPGGQHAGLAGAGAGQHQHRTIDGEHRLALFGIEPGQIGWLMRRRLLGGKGRVERIGIAVKPGIVAHGTGCRSTGVLSDPSCEFCPLASFFSST